MPLDPNCVRRSRRRARPRTILVAEDRGPNPALVRDDDAVVVVYTSAELAMTRRMIEQLDAPAAASSSAGAAFEGPSARLGDEEDVEESGRPEPEVQDAAAAGAAPPVESPAPVSACRSASRTALRILIGACLMQRSGATFSASSASALGLLPSAAATWTTPTTIIGVCLSVYAALTAHRVIDAAASTAADGLTAVSVAAETAMATTARETAFTIEAVEGQVRWVLAWLTWSGTSIIGVRLLYRYVDVAAVATILMASCRALGVRVKRRVFADGVGLGPGPVRFDISTLAQRPPALSGRESLVEAIDEERVRQQCRPATEFQRALVALQQSQFSVAPASAGGLRVTQVSGRRSYEHNVWRVSLYEIACTCAEHGTHGPLCRHAAASLLHIKRSSALSLTDANAESARLRCENQQLRNEVRRLQRRVGALEEDLVVKTEQWADLAEKRLDVLQRHANDLARMTGSRARVRPVGSSTASAAAPPSTNNLATATSRSTKRNNG